MQFMMLMIPNVYRGNKKLDSGFVPDPKKVEEMARFNGELGKAVKILSLNGLHPLNTGARVAFGKGKPTVTDGPFIESKEVLGGYWIVEANSKEELVKWAQRCPADEGDVIEIRQIFDEVEDRVLVLATGGMSHYPGTPLYGHVDEAFDKKVLDILASGKGSKLAEFTPDDLMQSGNGELVNWVITAGICGDVKCRVLDYIRLWHIGLGYLYWDM